MFVVTERVVQLLLQHPKRFSLGFLNKVKLQSLAEALGLTLGLRVACTGVFLNDSWVTEFVLKLM